MWIRKLGVKGNAIAVTLPTEALKALGWEEGEWVIVRVLQNGAILLTRSSINDLNDRLLQEAKPLPTIPYGRPNNPNIP